jgi:Spy/CpxP family protein refolding chaperone
MFSRSKAWALGLLAAVFVAGVALGGAAQAWAGRHDGPGGRAGGTAAVVKELTRELSLTAVQQDSVRAVFDRHRSEMEAVWKRVHPQFDSLRQLMRTEISAQLTPTQQDKYRALLAEHDRRRAAADSAAANGGRR